MHYVCVRTHVCFCVCASQGYRVGSEFWSLPQQYGDEMSGITATLTRTEQGAREAVTRVGRPFITQQELGICTEPRTQTSN